jgi:hypothetical protein
MSVSRHSNPDSDPHGRIGLRASERHQACQRQSRKSNLFQHLSTSSSLDATLPPRTANVCKDSGIRWIPLYGRIIHLISLGCLQSRIMKNHLVAVLCVSLLALATAVAQQPPSPFTDPNLPAEMRINSLLSLMTTEEKINCLGTRTGVPRLGVPNIGSSEGIRAAPDATWAK